jgi:hypothetical protein
MDELAICAIYYSIRFLIMVYIILEIPSKPTSSTYLNSLNLQNPVILDVPKHSDQQIEFRTLRQSNKKD